nr:MAG TPA: Transcriptional regulator, MarR family, Neisseria meningitidis, transcription factor.1A [Caudoviricetes sp.]
MKPVISINELMNRWDLSRPAITKMEQDGLLKRLKLPGVKYSMKNVLELEGMDSADWTHSPFEWRRLKDELARTQQDLERCQTFISQLAANMSRFEYEERRQSNEDHEDLRAWTDSAKA